MKSSFNNKKILITGHTGFKGSWLSLWLHLMGAKVYGVSNNIPTKPSHFELLEMDKFLKSEFTDIKNFNKIKNIVGDISPDYIFHLAAQPIVKISYIDPIETWNTNLLGTINILESLKSLKSKCSAVFITSDKCYKNNEWVWGYRENDELGGDDPYSASKGAAEIAISSYFESYFKKSDNIKIASTRAGNVIGGGDWAADRIVPDIIKHWQLDKKLSLRNPKSTRPWQHVLEPLRGYLRLGSYLWEDRVYSGNAFNFGPNPNEEKTVEELVQRISQKINYKNWISEINDDHFHESGLLKLNCDKAARLLDWKPLLDFDNIVSMTSDWYFKYYTENNNIFGLSKAQIDEYSELIQNK